MNVVSSRQERIKAHRYRLIIDDNLIERINDR